MNDSKADFGYLHAVAEKYGNFYLLEDFQRFANEASQEQVKELALAYQEISRREDSYRISCWIDDCALGQNKKSYKEYWFSSKVGQLICLFDHLADKGIAPFNSREVKYLNQVKKPEWNKLPERLHYLIPAAARFGKISSELEAIGFLESKATSKDFELLSKTAAQIKQREDFPILDQWLRKQSFSEHAEAWLVYCLLMVLDHANLD